MFKIINIGKSKDSHISALEYHYLKQMKDFQIIELKSLGDKHQELEMKSLSEQLEKYPHSCIFLMTENGKEFSTKKFSEFIEKKQEQFKEIIFVIAGSSGFSEKFKQKYTQHLSLSKLTFPHKIARLLLIEQVYRAISIINHHPYHK